MKKLFALIVIVGMSLMMASPALADPPIVVEEEFSGVVTNCSGEPVQITTEGFYREFGPGHGMFIYRTHGENLITGAKYHGNSQELHLQEGQAQVYHNRLRQAGNDEPLILEEHFVMQDGDVKLERYVICGEELPV